MPTGIRNIRKVREGGRERALTSPLTRILNRHRRSEYTVAKVRRNAVPNGSKGFARASEGQPKIANQWQCLVESWFAKGASRRKGFTNGAPESTACPQLSPKVIFSC